MQYKKPETFKAIEDFINEYADTYGTVPTIRDIANGVGLARSSVSSYLQAMEERGEIEYDEHRKPLTRMLLNDLSNMTRSPLLRNGAPIVGSVSCGTPVETEEVIEETVRLPKSIFGDGPLFILHASGESMIEAGIDDGDLVVIKQQQTANTGDIVVALVDGATTLKGYFPEPEKKRIRLQPANSTMKPMYFKDVQIQGVAVKVIKDAIKM